ncbi:MAG TPA: TSUP family transporter, partial [Mycobacteriales bacterium]
SVTVLFGLLAGFTTMVANAAGPVMSIYLLATGTSMMTFLGTGAWFYLVVNLFKVPFSLALGLIDFGSVRLDGQLLPAMLAGALIGRLVVSRLDQGVFEGLVLFFTLAASVNLLR